MSETNNKRREESLNNKRRIDKPQLDSIGKMPPQAVDAEESVIGAMLVAPKTVEKVVGILNAEDFYNDTYKKIYSCIVELDKTGIPADLLTLTKILRKRGELEIVGGPYAISKLTDKVSNVTNIEYHCRIIQQMSMKRELIRKSAEIIQNGYDDTSDIFDLIDDIGQWCNTLGAGTLVTTERINASTLMQKDNELVTIDGKRFLSVGNVSGIVAPYGVGKSNLMGAISAGIIDPECDGLGFRGNLYGKKIFHADTESSHNDGVAHYRRILRRIDFLDRGRKYMNGDDIEQLVFERFKGIADWKDRRRVVDSQIRTGKYKVVLLDGLTDFIGDPNNLQESQDLMGWLGAMASRYELGVIFTIHDNVASKHSENKGKARGHIGAEAARKSEGLLYLRKSKADDRIREITNDFEFQKMRNDSGKAFSHYMIWSEEMGLFVSTDAMDEMKDGKELTELMKIELFYKSIYIDTPRPMSHKELIDRVMEAEGVKDRRARDKIAEALQMEFLFKLESGLIYNKPEWIEPERSIGERKERQGRIDYE